MAEQTGFDWIKVTTTIILVLVTAAIFLEIGYFIGANSIYESEITQTNSALSPVSSSTETADADGMLSYQNSVYGFSFKYPAGFLQYSPNTSDKSGKFKTLFAIGFKDPDREKEIQQAQCINNEMTEWSNKTPAKEECDPILSGLSDNQKQDLFKKNGNAKSKNILVYIYRSQTSKTLADWLTEKYKQPNTELQDYAPGKSIKIADKDGLVSNIGCCDGYYLNYVFANSDYIFELGTNDQSSDMSNGSDNSFLDQISKTFKFTKE